MKKSEIEKRMLAKRLRNKMNENYILTNGNEKYSLTESVLKKIINEAVKNVLNKISIK